MTTPMLEFRGLDLLSALDDPRGEGLRIQVVRGFLARPTSRGDDYIVAAKPGRMVGNRVADVLKIGLAGYIAAAAAETWRSLTDDLLAVLDESGQSPGSLIARAPYLGLATGETATIAARVANVIEGEVAAKLRQTWSIELESVDPYWIVTT